VNDPLAVESHTTPGCPFCEVYGRTGHDGGRCLSCRGFLSEGLLEALRRIPGVAEIFPPPPVAIPAESPAAGEGDGLSELLQEPRRGFRT
jgi:hypothetical protein